MKASILILIVFVNIAPAYCQKLTEADICRREILTATEQLQSKMEDEEKKANHRIEIILSGIEAVDAFLEGLINKFDKDVLYGAGQSKAIDLMFEEMSKYNVVLCYDDGKFTDVKARNAQCRTATRYSKLFVVERNDWRKEIKVSIRDYENTQKYSYEFPVLNSGDPRWYDLLKKKGRRDAYLAMINDNLATLKMTTPASLVPDFCEKYVPKKDLLNPVRILSVFEESKKNKSELRDPIATYIGTGV